MLYRDIAERHNVQHVLPLKELVKFLLANPSREFSVNKIFNKFKSQGMNVSKNSLYKYIDYCSDAFILMPVANFSESPAKHSVRKNYSIDTGLSLALSFSLSRDEGRLLENMIFLELKRKGYEIYFYKNSHECDFIIKKKEKVIEAIQVCYEMTSENRQREIDGLKLAMKRFNLNKGLIITASHEETIENIKVLPAWKWLLQDN